MDASVSLNHLVTNMLLKLGSGMPPTVAEVLLWLSRIFSFIRSLVLQGLPLAGEIVLRCFPLLGPLDLAAGLGEILGALRCHGVGIPPYVLS